MATTDVRQQTHQSVLPQRTALESVSADNPGVGTKRGTDAGNTAPGVDHGRGERAHRIRRRATGHGAHRHGRKAAAGIPEPTGSDPGTSNTASSRPLHPRVFVQDRNQQPLMPCHPARARELLAKGRARVHKLYPFTIRLVDRTIAESAVEGVAVSIDPGSKFTGIAIVRETTSHDEDDGTEAQTNRQGPYGIEVQHRGRQVHRAMQSRAARRRGRRSRNTRYRAPRFDNRTRTDGWLAPSQRHRVEGVQTWVTRLRKIAPVTRLSMELVRFDLQQHENPEISGVEYQQGTLAGYEVREYLLQKWNHACANGKFNITTGSGTVQGIHHRHCRLVTRADGWTYTQRKEVSGFLPALKDGAPAATPR